MASLKDIRRRIASVKSTQKITRAMKLVAAAKLRRAQDNIIRARPYSEKVRELTSDLVYRGGGDVKHPLLAERPVQNIALVVLTSDRGLCGAFNANMLRAMQVERAKHQGVKLWMVGRKGRTFCQYRQIPMEKNWEGVDIGTALDISTDIADQLIAGYTAQTLDRVVLVYNEFKSALVQDVRVYQLLPILPEEPAQSIAPLDYLYEPEKQAVFDSALPMYVKTEMHRASLETLASEQGARMTAMENATRSASDLVRALTLQYNKERQNIITKELLEIVAGAEAM